MLVVAYDENGGFFDHVPPLNIGANVGGFPIATTGVRVPAFVVSPHVAPGIPFTAPLDHTSFLQLLADRFNPGQSYSADVGARQSQLGRLSTVLTQVPSGAVTGPSIPTAATVDLVAMDAAGPASSGQADSPGSTRTAQAFDNVARKMANDHPELLAGAGWSKLANYVATLKR